jgi:hypothetical protein
MAVTKRIFVLGVVQALASVFAYGLQHSIPGDPVALLGDYEALIDERGEKVDN